MTNVQERAAPSDTTQQPAYATLLVHVESELATSPRVDVAVRLARQFRAHLIGVAAEGMDYRYMYDGGPLIAEIAKGAEEAINGKLHLAHEAFDRDASGVDHEWRQAVLDPVRFLTGAARTADLVILGAATRTRTPRSVSPADIIMAAGRPVLIVPPNAGHLQGRKIVIAWKDTREARRAIADAMPFLVRAEDVIVQGVCSSSDTEAVAFQTNEVAQALKRHGAPARSIVTTASEDQVAHEIDVVASLNNADLVVAGAYGHNRLSEWAFGGVTDDLLHDPRRFVLMSH